VTGERFFAINMIFSLARRVPSDRREIVRSLILQTHLGDSGRKIEEEALAIASLVSRENVDWNEILRAVNRHFDSLTTIYNETTFNRRKSKIVELRRLGLLPPERPATVVAEDQVPQKVADALLAQAAYLRDAILSVDERSVASVRLANLSLELAAYHNANGAYPTRIAEVSQQLRVEMPKDPFSGGDFLYKPVSEGYILYSVGPNGRDDGGDDPESTPPGDDIAVRVPRMRSAIPQ
jgi:hypothetical protein